MHTIKKEERKNISPALALKLLRNGNMRFVLNQRVNRDFSREIDETKEGQAPFACILSCIDSRVPPSLIFDQGIGDVFSIRIAGNVINDDVLGSMEFACKAAGSKIIVVMGHTRCGAVKGCCENVRMGYLSGLLDKIRPAIERARNGNGSNGHHESFVDAVAAQNVHHVMDQIAAKSPILHEMAEKGQICIVGGMYNIETGRVEFYEHPDLCPIESGLSAELLQTQSAI